MRRSIACFLTLLSLTPAGGAAVSTRSFVVESSEGFEKGTLKGTAAHASGKLTRSVTTERTPLEGVPIAYASTATRDGAIYVATGTEGSIYRVDKAGAKLFADTPAALVTSLVWVAGTLFAATLPEGRVFAISGDGKVREHAKLTGADHVWALAYSEPQRTLYAATGPEGKLFALDAQGRAQLVHDDEAEHLLCLDVDGEGRVYVGTSDGARLLRIAGREVTVLYDFPGQELTTLDLGRSFLAVASNEFPPPPPAVGEGKDLGGLARAKRNKPGKGTVYAVDFDGRVQELDSFESAHVSALEVDDAGSAVQVGLAHEGRIVRLSRSGERALWADVDERQIAAIHLQGSAPHFLSSDGVALYRVGAPPGEGEWVSAVLDAKAPARFGELTLRATGTVRLSTRSGNTEVPDDRWSAWSLESTAAAPIKSPGARFLQVRAKLVGPAELYGIEAYYLPQNRPARVRNVRAKPKSEEAGKPQRTLLLSWDVDNPDEDKLRYRLYAQREGQSSALPLLREQELLEQAEYSWDVGAMPEGRYRVKVVASDEAMNPERYALKAEAVSAPILVDTRAPALLELRSDGRTVAGKVVDGLGPVTLLEVAVDSEPYRIAFPLDDLLDTREERFAVPLPKLAPGLHRISVRAADAARNQVSETLEVQIR